MEQVPDSSNPLRRTTKVAESIAREIVQDVSQNQLPPGTRLLSENQALAHYRVSRGSMREALRMLEDLGLVIIRPGPFGGPVVSRVTPRNYARTSTFYFQVLGVTLRQLAEARVALEPMIARMTAERKDPELISRLTDLLARNAEPGEERWAEEAMAFHEELLSNSGNPILDLQAHALQALYADRVRPQTVSEPDRERTIYYHTAIAQAIVDGDGDRAERLTREHLDRFLSAASARDPDLLEEIVDWR
jgi:GntR family transcriptional regulator, transcriptional repressor for pyruvate dehydrogenase complex